MKCPFSKTMALALCLSATSAFAAGAHQGGHGIEAAIGLPGKAANINRTLTVSMSDQMRFTPAHINVQQNETVKMVIKNEGKLKHELVLGSEKALAEHSALMQKQPDMKHADEKNMVSVEPGETREIVWQFTQSGKVDFACLIPGHFEAGMRGAVMVAKVDHSKMDHGAMKSSTNKPTIHQTRGKINRVNAKGVISLTHEPIPSLGWPTMTMRFQVEDKALLDKLKAGETVDFSFKEVDKKYIITEVK